MDGNEQMCSEIFDRQFGKKVWKFHKCNGFNAASKCGCIALRCLRASSKEFHVTWSRSEKKKKKCAFSFKIFFFARHFFVKSIYLLDICLQFCGLFSSPMYVKALYVSRFNTSRCK